jgi:hypothetical protein
MSQNSALLRIIGNCECADCSTVFAYAANTGGICIPAKIHCFFNAIVRNLGGAGHRYPKSALAAAFRASHAFKAIIIGHIATF